MRKSSLVFLILILCAAVTVGTTLGLISNMRYITAYLQEKNPVQPTSSNDGISIPDPVTKMETTTEPNSQNPPTKELASAANPSRSFDSRTPQLIILSESEVREIGSMLMELGYTNPNLSQSIGLFQKRHKLPTSGYLDMTTLNLIIQEVTQKKAKDLANGR